MKINKKNPSHWIKLVISGINIVATAPLSFIPKNKRVKRVIFYDQMNGNSKAFSLYLRQNRPDVEQYYLAFPDYHKLYPYKDHYVKPLNMLNIIDMAKVARSNAIITNFGIQTLVLYTYLTKIPFIDVWHGVPYKGFVPKDFSFLRRYKEVWVSSPTIKNLYKNKFDVPDRLIHVTGYSRVDGLADGRYDKSKLKSKYGVDSGYKNIILLAPTWKQDDKNRTLIPFGELEHDFLNRLNETAKSLNSLIIFRAHRGSGRGVEFNDHSNIKMMPASVYTETEEILYMADVLITDWSSIAFDFLPLRRPVIYLDVKPPFRNGFSLDDRYRFGKVVKSIDELCFYIRSYIKDPRSWSANNIDSIDKSIVAAYGNTLDGMSASRYLDRLMCIIDP